MSCLAQPAPTTDQLSASRASEDRSWSVRHASRTLAVTITITARAADKETVIFYWEPTAISAETSPTALSAERQTLTPAVFAQTDTISTRLIPAQPVQANASPV